MKILKGDCLKVLKTFPDNSIQCVVTSPPYWGLRDYGFDGQIGLEKNMKEYITKLVSVFEEVRRVLRNDGTLWLNLGDSYAGSGKGLYGDGLSHGTEGKKQRTNKGSVGLHKVEVNLKAKNLLGMPWRVAFALQEYGWILRSDIIWNKPNVMPESVQDRPTRSHEFIFLFSKFKKYYYNSEAVKEPLAQSLNRRLCQSTFDSQTGGSKDPINSGTGNTNRSCRKALENLKIKCGPNSRANVDRVPRKDLKQNRIQKGTYVDFNARYVPVVQRNLRDVWNIALTPYKESHFATFPQKLVETCLLAGTKEGDVVLDPFAGSGTTLAVAKKMGRDAIGIEANPEYIKLIHKRLQQVEEKNGNN